MDRFSDALCIYQIYILMSDPSVLFVNRIIKVAAIHESKRL